MNHARTILTDSGGIQKKAYILKVPCITLRENTEWVKKIDDGWNILVGSNKETILQKVNEFSPSLKSHKNRFGNGDATEKIVSVIDEINCKEVLS